MTSRFNALANCLRHAAMLVFVAVYLSACGGGDVDPVTGSPPTEKAATVLTPLDSAKVSAGYVFTQIDFPGGVGTSLAGINASGTVIGNSGFGDGTGFGFVLSNGQFNAIRVPGAASTVVSGVNKAGDIVGYYDNPSGIQHGFILSNSVFTTFDISGATQVTRLMGISDSGLIVGDTSDRAIPKISGFILEGGNTTMLQYLDVAITYALGVNGRGTVVGAYAETQSAQYHGLVFNGGIFEVINYPGAVGTVAAGVNNVGDIVGTYFVPNATNTNTVAHGFLRSRDKFTTVDFPDAYSTNISGISSKGYIVGSFIDSENRQHGFIARKGASKF